MSARNTTSIHILSYKDSGLRLGADREYDFTGKVPAQALYALLRDRMYQRLVAAVSPVDQSPGLPAKHLGGITGTEGTFETISSSGAFELTITTLEKPFHFQLKQPITEARYNELWLQIEKKNGRIQ